MKKVKFLILTIFFFNAEGQSQEPDPSWGIKFSGFVKTDIFYDTRQSSASNGLREGHFYLFPDPSQRRYLRTRCFWSQNFRSN